MHLIDEKFRKNPLPFFTQSALAALFLAITFYLVWNINPLVVAGMGSTTFVLFATPESSAARPRAVVGGYIISMLVGLLFFPLPDLIIAGSLAVGTSIFVMTIMDAEHPPASAIALGVAVNGFSYKLLVFIVLATSLLSFFQRRVRKHIRDLV